MLKIRLQRKGKKGEPHYRIVVIESTRARDSKYIADLGYFNPHSSPSTFALNKESAEEWLKKGARPSPTIAQYLVKEGMLKDWKESKRSKQGLPKKKKKAESEEKSPVASPSNKNAEETVSEQEAPVKSEEKPEQEPTVVPEAEVTTEVETKSEEAKS